MKPTTKKLSYFNFFKSMGYDQYDHMGLGKHRVQNKFERKIMTMKALSELLDNGLEEETNYYYNISVFKADTFAQTKQRKDYVYHIRQLIIDIDYGLQGHKKAQFETQEQAYTFIREKLLKPSAIIHSGHGFQVHYRLSEDKNKSIEERKKQYEIIAKSLSDCYPIDCCNSCQHLFRLPFSFNYKNKSAIKEVRIIEINFIENKKEFIEYSINDFKTLIPTDYVYTEYSSKEKQQSVIRRVIKEQKSSGKDRSAMLYSIIMRSIMQYPVITDKTILVMLKKENELFQHYQSEQQALKDIRRIRGKTDISTIQPILEQKEVNVQNISLQSLNAIRNRFNDTVFNSAYSKFDTVLKILMKLHTEKQSGILNVPCASGKTYSSLIYCAYLATLGKRTWIVSQKIQDCKRNASILQKLGINAIGFHGKDKSICTIKEDLFNHREMCSKCEHKCGAEIKYLSNNKFDYPSASIVCTTHKHYLNVLGCDMLPSDLQLVIIDESPSVIDSYTVSKRELKTVMAFLNNDDNIEFQSEWIQNIENVLTDKGTHRINFNIDGYRGTIIKYVFMQLNNKVISHELAESVFRFIYFFSNKNIYGMSSNNEYTFMSGEVSLSTDITTIILDGSARNSINKWNNFKIYSCKELDTHYSKSKIYCLNENPTQKSLQKGEIFESIIAESDKVISNGQNVLIFNNKDLSNKENIQKNIQNYIKYLQSKECSVVTLPRGQHIGSNLGRECSQTVIAMSLFSTVFDYALRASIFNDSEISESEIFRKTEKGQYFIKFSHGKFQNKLINDMYLRSVQRDLYQAILRGCIRDNSEAVYKVICLISSNQIVKLLKQDLPSAEIILIGQDIFQMYSQGYSEEEIAQKLGKKQPYVSRVIQSF